jgi:hypothetical protein
MALRESFVFLATEDLEFTRSTLAHNIENDYLPLYIYTLYQKHQLLIYADDLMREVAHARRNSRGVRSLMDRFVNFRHQYWFNEITRKAQGTDLYHKLQEGLEIPALYQLVTASVNDAQAYYQDLRDRRGRLLLTLLSLIFGPVTVVLGAMRVFLDSEFPWWTKVLLLIGIIGGAAGILIAFWRYEPHWPRLFRQQRGKKPVKAEPTEVPPDNALP